MTAERHTATLIAASNLALLWVLMPMALLLTPLWAWPIPSLSRLFTAVALFSAALWAGAMTGCVYVRARVPAVADPERTLAPGSVLTGVLILTSVVNAVTLVTRAGFNPFACDSLLECSTAAYNAYIDGSLAGEGAALEYVRILLGPVLAAAVAASLWIMIFRPRGVGLLLPVIVLLSELVIAVATGTSRNLANLVLFGLFLLFVKSRSGLGLRDRPKIGLRTYILGALAVLLFFLYFAFTQLNRDGLVAAVGLLPFNGGYIEAWTFQNDSDNLLMKGLESAARYLCTGYFSLSLALMSPSGLTFPLGSSMVLARRAELGGDSSYINMSLPGQLQSIYDWSYLQQWHSIYSWLLSDYSMLGVSVIMFVGGFCFSLALSMALVRTDWISKLPIYLFFIGILYIPANNQLLQGFESAAALMASLVLLLAYLIWLGPRSQVRAAASA